MSQHEDKHRRALYRQWRDQLRETYLTKISAIARFELESSELAQEEEYEEVRRLRVSLDEADQALEFVPDI